MFRHKREDVIHIDFSTRPVVAVCGCGKMLRGRNGRLPADRIYFISGELTCRDCAIEWLDRRYEMTDVM